MSTITEVTDYLVASAVVMTAGPPTEQGFGGAQANREFPRMQFLSRAMAHDTARSQCQAAHDALCQVQAMTLGTTFYESITPNAPFLLKLDASGRVVYALNAQVIKESS